MSRTQTVSRPSTGSDHSDPVASCLFFVGRLWALSGLFIDALRREFWPTLEIADEWRATLRQDLCWPADTLDKVFEQGRGRNQDGFLRKNSVYLSFFRRKMTEADALLSEVKSEEQVVDALDAILRCVRLAHHSLSRWREQLLQDYPAARFFPPLEDHAQYFLEWQAARAALDVAKQALAKAIERRQQAQPSSAKALRALDLQICRTSRKYFLALFAVAVGYPPLWTEEEQRAAIELHQTAIAVMSSGDALHHTQVRLEELEYLSPTVFSKLACVLPAVA